MQQLIDELKAIPGVIGVGLYSVRDGLRVTNLPGVFKPERLETLGQQLAKLYGAGLMKFPDLTDVTLNYDESVVAVRALDANLFLFVLYEPSCGATLLNMSMALITLLQKDYLAGKFQLEVIAEPEVMEEATEEAVETGPDATFLHLIVSMREQLAAVLGPMADLIFDDAYESWKKQGEESPLRMESLLEQIKDEIGDEQKNDQFVLAIEPVLKSLGRG